MMCAVLAEIRFQLPVPAMQAAGMYGHTFVNGGNAAQLSGTGRPLKQTLKDFVRVHQTWRWSAVSPSLFSANINVRCLCLGKKSCLWWPAHPWRHAKIMNIHIGCISLILKQMYCSWLLLKA